jgi:hypothetical protein
MKQNSIEEGRLSNRGHGLGTVTEEMVEQRAGEIAIINGRSKRNILESDLQEARRELTGEEHLNPSPSLAETLTEDDRWQEVPEGVGHKAETVPSPDEQTVAEKLVEEGVQDAEHDQEIEATRESLKRDK